MEYNIYAIGIMTAIVSFLGFVVENIWLAISKGYINNRNMNTPFLLGYGLLIMFMYFTIGTPGKLAEWKIFKKAKTKFAKYMVYFLCAMLIVSISEIVLGVVVEELCGFEYWNYSNIPLHITKYTSVPTSMAFATMITFVMGKLFNPIMNWIVQVDCTWIRVLSIILIVIMAFDFIISFYHMIHNRNFYLKWKIIFRCK
ncbi:MAG: hypothetical protein HFG39_05220 [Lachnospiraceae bacterium]|nr:hypothetical protein [Lachnospiraceae bacterium]